MSTLTRILTTIILLASARSGHAQITIHGPDSVTEIGTIELLENTTGQTFEIYAQTSVTRVQGVNLNIQIGDGGPEAGGTDAPSITGVDILTGTIFESNNTGLGSASGILVPQVAFYSTTTLSSNVLADGLLATLVIDTNGFFADDGPFPLILSQTINNPTNFGPIVPTIIDGWIELTPLSGLPGDLNQDDEVDASDIDLLVAGIRAGSPDPAFDLDDSGVVDSDDLSFMITEVLGTIPGDANLDGEVNLLDLSLLATYFQQTAGWAGANFNLDLTVDLLDLSVLASHFLRAAPLATSPPDADTELGLTIETRTNEYAASVPEPGGALLMLLLSATHQRQLRPKATI
ncbi:hypothetical protein [Mucisphaera calidilacus]|uniref:Dockerin domain-containing protein n=1 Tax=Mucisphaera calidilacus TaxID=2527982 RepID=A0A518BX45_9BACT|nr:hypothetical protein [Mucisphaera calidilacus]QDU71552.1 hypothetical protein Pan265_14020 [Mucisphaera calidilacus]